MHKFAQRATPNLNFMVTIFVNVKDLVNGTRESCTYNGRLSNSDISMTLISNTDFTWRWMSRKRYTTDTRLLYLYRPLSESDVWPIELCHHRWLWSAFKVISAIFSESKYSLLFPVSDRNSRRRSNGPVASTDSWGSCFLFLLLPVPPLPSFPVFSSPLPYPPLPSLPCLRFFPSPFLFLSPPFRFPPVLFPLLPSPPLKSAPYCN